MKRNIFKDGLVLLLMIFLITTSTSCYQKFYKVSDNSGTGTIDSSLLAKPDKYYILRSGNNAFTMNDIIFNDDNKSLACTLDEPVNIHTVYLNANPKKSLKYKASKGQDVVLNEVHIYIPSDSSLRAGNKYNLDFNKIAKVEIIEKDKEKTSSSTVWSTVGIAAGTAAIIWLIIAANDFGGFGW
jgi:hypothetical protein